MRITNLKVTHSGITQEVLRVQLKKYSHARVGLRIAIVQGILNGEKISEISKRHKVSREFIYQLVRRINIEGMEGIVDRPHTGRKRQLNVEQEEKIKGVVSNSPRLAGYTYSRWDGLLVARYIKEEFGITYSTRQVQRILKRIGFTLQRPRKKYMQADPNEQGKFRENIKKTKNVR